MGMRRNKPLMPPDLNVDHHVGEGLPPLEFKGKRGRPKGKRRDKPRDEKGRRIR